MGKELHFPIILDVRKCAFILQILSQGHKISVALRHVGVSYACYNHWEKRWKNLDSSLPPYLAEFFNKVPTAETGSELHALALVMEGGPRWKGAAWFLERRFPKRWGKRVVVAVPIAPVDLASMTVEELDAFDQNLEKHDRG